MIPSRMFSLAAVPACLISTAWGEAAAAPEKALKYHEALLKRPHNSALFDRFFGAWIDEQPVESLGTFLKSRAEANGGQDWTVLATYELRRGNEDAALAALAKAIEAVPEDPALPMERGKLRLRRLEFNEARADLAKAAAGKDEVLALEASKLIGKSWLREGRTDEAIKAWDAVLAAHPGDEDLLEDLVETAAAESETAQALVYAGRLIEASKDPYQKTLRMLRRGDLLAQSGKSDEAIEAYSATLAQVGEGSWLEREVLAQIEKLYRKQDRIDDLSTQLKKLAEANPRRLLIHRQLAKLEAAQGETDAAIGRFREVLKRSPGERELREEFVRLLSDGERFDDAAAELEKLIELAPTESGLHLQVAALRSRQGKPEAVLAALKKAQELMGKDEGSGLRIASLMLQYNLNEPGEALLKELAAAPGAGPVALETLAAQYGRTERRKEAVELLRKAGSGEDVDILLRTTGSISALGESSIAYETLLSRVEKHSSEPRFLAALAQSALAAGKAAEAVPQAIKLVRLAKQTSELAESISLASRVVAAAEKSEELRASLAGQASRTPSETCLLASLIEDSGDFVEVGKLLDPATDPMVVHFHAALLDRRGDFDTAIAVLSRLADTEEGRKAAYFKDLSELQQRAGKMVEALATVERWKQSAPGDKTAWVTGSRLLRQSGKPEEAVKVTRQAVSRFEGDADLSASLASLHDEAGQWADAEAIYWRLYDEAQSPTDQARWAVMLAQLSQRTGKTGELEEKFRERAKGNRRSIGPVLAQAELARVTNNEDKRRDLLLEAVRLQPKDLDLRLQIATLEEQAGNPERVMAVLEEAIPYDVNGRVRSALAQAYLRQGQAVKGMRELRLLAGKGGFDARSAESAAGSLAGSKLYDEAISLLRSELPGGGDWRSRYLLAVLLEEDGRETEALPIFLSLLQAQGDLPSVAAPAVKGPNYLDQLPKEIRAMYQLMAANQSAYAHRANQNYSRVRYSSQASSQAGPFTLPDSADDVRRFSLIHLCNLSKTKTGEVDESVRAQIKAAGIGHAAFVSDLVAATLGNEPGNLKKLLETYPDQPGLYEWLISYSGMYGSDSGLDEKLTRRVLEHADKMSPMGRYMAWASLTMNAKPEDPAWTSMLEAAKACAEDKSSDYAKAILSRLMSHLQAEPAQGGIPEVHRAEAKKLLLATQKRLNDEEPEMAHTVNDLAIAAIVGSTEAWLEELNAVIRDARKNPARRLGNGRTRTRLGQTIQYAAMYSSRNGNYNPWGSMGDLFALPTFQTLPLNSIPQEVLFGFSDAQEGRYLVKPPVKIEELLKTPEKIGSPVLRAWLAAKVNNKEALAKALSATPPREEVLDFEILKAVSLIEEKKLPAGFAALMNARSSTGADREISTWIQVSLIAVAGAMTPEERTAVAGDLQATFLLCRPFFGPQGAEVLAGQARRLGLEELAKRIEPAAPTGSISGGAATGPAALAGASMRGSSSSSSSGSTDKIQKFIGEKKYEAAARDALQMYRSQATGSNSAYFVSNQFPRILAMLGKDGQAELLKLVEPGESKSLVKRLEYVDIAQAMGKPEPTLAVLESLLRERPNDAEISARLVFNLPESALERRLELMTSACKSDSFFTQANQVAERFDNQADTKQAMAFFETITRWLEGADERLLADANLTWVSYHAKEFLRGDYTNDLPSVISTNEEPKEDKATYEKFRALCERLARAMTRHASCAEEGFRLLNAIKNKSAQPTEIDELARRSLLATAVTNQNPQLRSYANNFFMLVHPNEGGSSSGDDLSEHSSASWLAKRLGELKSAGGILTPEFTTELKARNAAAGELVGTFNRELKHEDLATLWKSEMMKSDGGRLSQMLRPILIKRLSSAPGATRFFLDQIAQIPPGTAVSPNGSDRDNKFPLFSAALGSTLTGKPEEMAAVVKAISRAVFGEKVDFSDPKNQQRDYYRVNFMGGLAQQFTTDAPSAVRFHAVCLRLGVPVDDDEYGALQPFQNKRFQTYEEFEAFLESLGWLSEFDRWEPYACLIYRNSNGANGPKITVQPQLITERVFDYMSLNIQRSDIIKKLKERKKGRFGSLMAAAALSTGKERSQLAGQAFAENSAALSKLPADRLESLSLVLAWLPDDSLAKLPEAFRRKVEAAQAKRREEAIAAADQFIASLKSPNNRSLMDSVHTVVQGVAPYDLDKAVEVFVKADQEYTESLARGGRFSSYTSNDFQLSERDESFGRIMRSYGDELQSFDIKLRLKFLSRILASPSGKRLVFVDMNYSDRSVFSRAAALLLNEDNRSGNDADRILWMVEAYKAADPELKPMVFNCLMLAEAERGTSPRDQGLLEKAKALAGKDSQAMALVAYRCGLSYWDQLSKPEDKAGFRKLFATIISESSIPDVVRLMIANKAIQMRLADGLIDETTMPVVVKLYQDYCAGERSAVSAASIDLFRSLSKSPLTSEAMSPMYAALASAFWDNTSAAKPAGHPLIPSTLSQSAFVVTLLGKDNAAIAKVFPRIKAGLTGRLQPMISLMTLGKPDLARQLAPLPQDPFISEGPELGYTRKLEDSIAALKKEGVDPLTALKLEIELLGLVPGKEADAPAEPYEARLRRLTEAFIASPPTGNALTLSLHKISSRVPGEAKLAPLFNKWLKDNPLAGLLVNTDRSSNPLSSELREVGIAIHGAMAAEAFGAGDPSPIEAIRKELEQKTGRDYEVSQFTIKLMAAINLSIWHQVCVGNTSGFKSGMTAWNEMVLQSSKHIVNYSPSEVRNVLATSLLLACLTDREEAFGQLLDKMPEKARSYVKGINRDGGFFNFIESVRSHGDLEILPENATRRIFLGKVLSQPGFARSLTTQVGWVNRMVDQYGFQQEIDILSVNPPANLIPESLPALYEYGGRLAYKNDPEKGIALTRKGLEGCPEGEAWNGSRGMLKWQLADQLLASKKADEAKEIFVTIKPEEVAGWLKDRYNQTAKALGIEPPKPEAPKKEAPAPPKP